MPKQIPTRPDYSERVYAKQIRMAYSLLPVGLVATSLNAVVVAAMLWRLVPHAILVAWTTALLLLSLLRLAFYFICCHSKGPTRNIERLGTIFNAGMALSGAIWGFSAFFHLFHNSLPHQIFVAYVLGGMSAGAAATISALRFPYYGFVIPALLPQILLFLLAKDPIHVSMGGMLAFFSVLIAFPAEANAKTTKSNLWLQFEREDLVKSLSQEVGQREQAQGALRQAQAELERKVKERTAQLAQANTGLRREASEREQAQQALRRSEELYRSIFETVQEGIWIIGKDLRVLRANSRMASLLGYEASELSGRELREFMGDKELEVYSSGQTQNFREIPITDRNGKTLWVLEAANGLSASVLGEETMLCIVTDITGLKERERIILDLNRRLQEANRELLAFTHSVSHDLRSPLFAVDGFSRALEEEYGAELPATGKGYLARIRGAVRRMNELIEDLLKLSRVAQGELRVVQTDLGMIARDIVAVLRARHPGRAIEVRIQDNVPAVCDPKLMRIVLENLLGNAWKFTGRKEHASIEFGSQPGPEGTIYFVRDNGSGFDMAQAHRLFTPFQRLHAETEFPGTGIGLATVNRIIRRHGGTVWAEAEPGKGATFFFTLAAGPSEDFTTEAQSAQRWN